MDIFFAISYTDSTDAIKVYIDNTSDQSALTAVFDTTHPIGGAVNECRADDCILYGVDSFMGCRMGSTPGGALSDELVGDIADIRLFDSVLSVTDIESVRDDR